MLDLGDALRRAQDDADRDRLRELAAERRALLNEVAASLATRAEETGQHAGDAALEEVQQTLQAALASPEAAAAVRTGRLVRTLDADGLDAVDLDGAVAGGAPDAVPPRTGRSTDAGDAEDDRREAERQAEERARRLREARDRADEAAAYARDADAAAEDRRRDAADLRRRVDELQARLDAAEQAVEEAGSAAAAAHDAADAAAADAEQAAAGS